MRILGIFLILISAAALVQAQTVNQFLYNDSRITYTGTWYSNTNSLEIGGSSTLTNFKTAEAIVIFNGTGISWIGTSDGYSGECYVTVDGQQVMVDTSNAASNTYYQRTLYSLQNLPAGTHHMTIYVMHARDDTTQGSWIWVNAFNVTNGSLVAGPIVAGAGLSDDTSPSANYDAHWYQKTGSQYSGGSVNLAVDPGAQVDFTFNGTAVSWIGYRDQYSGIAEVYIDGNMTATVDTYANPAASQTVTWSINGLSPGTHTLSIAATGTADSQSGGAFIWVDAFQVSGTQPAGVPTISANGVVSAASFAPAPNNQVAPGQIVSIFGSNFTTGASLTATTLPLPTQLGPENTTVSACGHAVPLFLMSSGQINAQIPLECPASGTVSGTITAGGQTGSQTFTLAQAAPGIFTVNSSGSGDGIILHANNTLVSSSSPAAAGETVVIYATGLGPTSPAFADGAAANTANNTVLPITATIGGQPAAVVYAGLTQSLVGLYQVNVVVPSGLTGHQPVVITAGTGNVSPAGVMIWLQ